MAYKQIREIVKELGEKHRQASEACRRYQSMEASRSELLLEHFEAFENDVRIQMQVDDQNEREEIMETWIQYIPMEPVDTALENLRQAEPDQCMEFLLDFHRAVTELLETLSEQVAGQKPKMFFQSLTEAEKTFARQCSTAQIRDDEI